MIKTWILMALLLPNDVESKTPILLDEVILDSIQYYELKSENEELQPYACELEDEGDEDDAIECCCHHIIDSVEEKLDDESEERSEESEQQ